MTNENPDSYYADDAPTRDAENDVDGVHVISEPSPAVLGLSVGLTQTPTGHPVVVTENPNTTTRSGSKTRVRADELDEYIEQLERIRTMIEAGEALAEDEDD